MIALAQNGTWQIAVLPAGHVLVGRALQEQEKITLTNCAVIRRWGTSHGLGELAATGPLANTILDRCPPVAFYAKEAIFLMQCATEAWDSSGL